MVLVFEGGFVWNNREEESRVLTFTVWLNVVNALHSSNHLLWRATGFLQKKTQCIAANVWFQTQG